MKSDSLAKLKSELQKGIDLEKCRKCGCMADALDTIYNSEIDDPDLKQSVKIYKTKMHNIEYSCLGCKHCYAAEVLNYYQDAFELTNTTSSNCIEDTNKNSWPVAPGEFYADCKGNDCPVAVSTLSSNELAEILSKAGIKELCIVGKTETENIGIDKIIKNIITNSTIKYLILTGKDTEGHKSGQTILSLWKNGIDENHKVIGSQGKRPFLANSSFAEIENFRKQIKVIDMIGCLDVNKIINKIRDLTKNEEKPCSCIECNDTKIAPVIKKQIETITAKVSSEVKLDKLGYFVILPQKDRNIILVEYYSYENKLLHIVEGYCAKDIYLKIIENGWISQLDHAAYIGKELEKAELSIKFNFKYVQDGA